MANDEIDRKEYERRILFSTLVLPSVISDAFEISLKDLSGFSRLARFKLLRERGLTIAEIGELLDVSLRTAKTLNKELRSSFFLPEKSHNEPLRIELMLWGSPMSRGRLQQVAPELDVDAALETLLAEGRIEARREGTVDVFHVTQSINSQIGSSWTKMIGGLNSVVENLSNVVLSRFVKKDGNAFARTLSFHATREQDEELQAAFSEFVARIAQIDEHAQASGRSHPVRLSLFWHIEDDTE